MQSLHPEEYLERHGVTPYLKDMMTLLLENRPENPVEFMREYFGNVVHGSTPLIRAYRYVRLGRTTQPAFMDNLVAAYTSLQCRRGAVGVLGSDYQVSLFLGDRPCFGRRECSEGMPCREDCCRAEDSIPKRSKVGGG